MSIRLRLTLLYTAILAVTLLIFGGALFLIQSQYTLNALRSDLNMSGGGLARLTAWRYLRPTTQELPPEGHPDGLFVSGGSVAVAPFENLAGEPAFRDARERDIVRVLNTDGTLFLSPFGGDQQALPISDQGLQAVQDHQVFWQIATEDGNRLLIRNEPVIVDDEMVLIVQVARRLTERDRTLFALGRTLMAVSLVMVLAAFGIGWWFTGATLSPIHRITQTAQAIGNESDFSRRVAHKGPNDEIGRLATTFNSMLSRLQNAYQRVHQSLQLQRDFVADVSHELRTPLTTVHGNIVLLRRDPPPSPAEQADILTDMEEESERLIRLVNGLLVMARAEAGYDLLKEPLPLRQLIEDTCRQAAGRDEKRRILYETVNLDDSQELVVLGDRDALKQALLILLDNALKFSTGEVQVATTVGNGQVLITVSDRGPGIPLEQLPHVFDRFYRGDDPQQAAGFGLGLPIAKVLINGMGGEISIDSRPGEGSTVRISLPRAG